jgi:hypothetical protein
MSVRIYQFGVIVGGVEADGSTIPSADSASGTPDTFEGAVAAQTTITFSSTTKSVTIRNTHDTASFEVSLDSGSTWILFASYAAETINAAVASLLIRPVAAASSYEITGIV